MPEIVDITDEPPEPAPLPSALATLPLLEVASLFALLGDGSTSELHHSLKTLLPGCEKMGARAKVISAMQEWLAAGGVVKTKETGALVRYRVQVRGLQSRADINGKFGAVTGFNKEKSRYSVRIDGTKTSMLLKPDNLAAVTPEEEDAARRAEAKKFAKESAARRAAAAKKATDEAEAAAVQAAEAMDEDPATPPLRCPACILSQTLPRLPEVGVKSDDKEANAKLQQWLKDGQAFSAPARSIVGDEMGGWDFEHLAKHLPAEQKFNCFNASGGSEGGKDKDVRDDIARFAQSEAEPLTFADFLSAVEKRGELGEGGRPHLNFDLLRRASKEDKDGAYGPIGETLLAELRTFGFEALAKVGWPVISSMDLFIGCSAAVHHTRYELKPTLHFQLVGKTRFIVFPPDQWRQLYPFACHHDLDRRSRLDLDAPDDERFPDWRSARGVAIELHPGDCLYLPPYWWHHVQSCSTPCVSTTISCYDTHPMPRDVMPSSSAAKHVEEEKRKKRANDIKEQVGHIEAEVSRGTLSPQALKVANAAVQASDQVQKPTPTVANCFGGHFFGLSTGGAGLSLLRWLEQAMASVIVFPEEAADKPAIVGPAKEVSNGDAPAGPAKQQAVAGWMRRIAVSAHDVIAWNELEAEKKTQDTHPLMLLTKLTEEEEAEQREMLGLPPLKAPFGQVAASLYSALASDMENPHAVAPWLVELTGHGRFDA